MLLAGHETSSTALTWLLWTLSSRPAIQDRLREEVRAAMHEAADDGRNELNIDDLNGMQYMDAVVVRFMDFWFEFCDIS